VRIFPIILAVFATVCAAGGATLGAPGLDAWEDCKLALFMPEGPNLRAVEVVPGDAAIVIEGVVDTGIEVVDALKDGECIDTLSEAVPPSRKTIFVLVGKIESPVIEPVGVLMLRLNVVDLDPLSPQHMSSHKLHITITMKTTAINPTIAYGIR
jgi:hypothetical protein